MIKARFYYFTFVNGSCHQKDYVRDYAHTKCTVICFWVEKSLAACPVAGVGPSEFNDSESRGGGGVKRIYTKGNF